MALIWLAVGAMLTLLSSWGCVLWQEYRKPIQAWNGLPPPVWTNDASLGWMTPDRAVETSGFGYKRFVSSTTKFKDSGGVWLDCDQAREHLLALDAARQPSPTEPPPDTPTRLDRYGLYRQAKHDFIATQARFDQFQRDSGWPVLAMRSRNESYNPLGTLDSVYTVGEEFSRDGASRMTPSQFLDRGLLWSNRALAPGARLFTLPLKPVMPGFLYGTLLWTAVALLVWRRWVMLRRRWRLKPGQCPRCRYQRDLLTVCPECGLPNADRVLMELAEPAKNV